MALKGLDSWIFNKWVPTAHW